MASYSELDPQVIVLLFGLFLLFLQLVELFERKSGRRMWIREINMGRQLHGFYNQFFLIIKERDPDQFFKATRMTRDQYDMLFNLINKKLLKTSHRKPIDPETRLAVTLLYLSQGAQMQVLAWSFKLGLSTIRKIIYETCEVIWDELKGKYLGERNVGEWQKIARGFHQKWNLPNCVGAIDGKHINIVCPPNSGSEYFNYKGHHSVVLLAACDDNYCFTAVDIGALGSRSDGGVFSKSIFGRKILRNELPPLPDKPLPNTNQTLPHFFVADAAFPLKRNIMRPYPGRNIAKEEEYFNMRLSRARRMIENAFGIMVARWRILLRTMNCLPDNAIKVVMAVVVLHNFIKMTNDSLYCPENFVDGPNDDAGLWRQQTEGLRTVHGQRFSNNASREAFEVRNKLKTFVNNNPIV